MTFADWSKRSPVFSLMDRWDRAIAVRVAQAAYKAGERQGRKDAEEMARRAIILRDKLAANVKIAT